jgi:predicted nucleotidyltransferase
MIELQTALSTLVANEVEFVIVGGVAITLHSSAYLTVDLDFCYSRTPDNVRQLVAALAPFDPKPRGFPPDLPFVFDEATIRNGTNFTFDTSIGMIDLLGEVKGVGGYKEAAERSDIFEVYGLAVKALNLDALIDAKTAAGRPKDHMALPELKALREALDPDTE